MFDHLGFNVRNFPTSREFYERALAPLGCRILAEGDGWATIGKDGVKIWFGSFGPAPSHIHIALTASSRQQVGDFYTAALAAGGTDNGAPGLRDQYGPHYYAAFIIDPDGHNVEAVCRATDAA